MLSFSLATAQESKLYVADVNNIWVYKQDFEQMQEVFMNDATELECNAHDQNIYWLDVQGSIKRGVPRDPNSIKVVSLDRKSVV